MPNTEERRDDKKEISRNRVQLKWSSGSKSKLEACKNYFATAVTHSLRKSSSWLGSHSKDHGCRSMSLGLLSQDEKQKMEEEWDWTPGH